VGCCEIAAVATVIGGEVIVLAIGVVVAASPDRARLGVVGIAVG
jgi:hypothetical protein